MKTLGRKIFFFWKTVPLNRVHFFYLLLENKNLFLSDGVKLP